MRKWLLVLAGLALFGAPASAVTIDWVEVGAPGNAADTPSYNCHAASCGAVAAPYKIGKYEVTNAQYVEMLNAVAASDPNALYSASMAESSYGGITRSGSSGSYSYAVKAGMGSKPVNYVSFWDGARFSNWLHNGQPTGVQTSLTTEDGAYTLTPAAMAANSVTRNLGATVFLPSENEWYKAAYYDPIGNVYFDYPAGANTVTVCSGPTAMANHANCYGGPGTVTDAGAYTGSASPNGTFDQGGNVWEWNEEIGGSDRGLRGGAWINFAGALSAADWGNVIPAGEVGLVGFRVASIPEPSTGLLLLSGLVGLALRRRVRG